MKPEDKDYTELFGSSYLKAVLSNPTGFFDRFYQLFRKADSRVDQLFGGTDMNRQLLMLEESLLYMIDFSKSRVSSSRLQDIADSHGSKNMNIPAQLFDVWMECLLDTLREHDPEFDLDTETAWRVAFAPGLAYMKSHCSPRPSPKRAESTQRPQE
jgi:hemoglobin-like flavoprotein